MKRAASSAFAAIAALVAIAAASGGCRTRPTARAVPFDSSIEWTFVTPENGVVDDETTAPSGMNDLCYAFTCVCDDGDGRRDRTLYWTGTPHRPYVNESAFGTLVLDDIDVPITVNEPMNEGEKR